MRQVKKPVPNPQKAMLEAPDLLLKDDVLSNLANVANVAQFISYNPRLEQRHARIYGYDADHLFESIESAVSALLKASPEGSVNVRSFKPGESKSLEFIYGLKTIRKVLAAVHRLARAGCYTIINETVNVNDGGVSGVMLGNVLEFAPKDTPRCVEKPGTASLPRQIGLRLLEKVYHFRPRLDGYARNQRVEFSIHPIKRGVERDHTIIWELERYDHVQAVTDIRWPNNFSRFMGDKAFGLLIADVLGLPVPSTTVFPRLLPPFSFGKSTGTAEVWIRTCPVEQDPGKFTTQRGWRDPYELMAKEDRRGIKISSLLAQEGVDAVYSGALIAGKKLLLEIDDIVDWPGFFSRLSDEGRYASPSPSRRITKFLPDTLWKIVRKNPQARKLDQAIKSAFVAALNRILKRRDFYEAKYFKRVTLTEEANALLSRQPPQRSGLEIQRLNRLILKASYPNEIGESEEIIIQGTGGYGDDFMLGSIKEELPEDIKDSVLQIYEQAVASLGPVRFEWVRDRESVWIVQLHRGITSSTGTTIYPGKAKAYHRFDVTKGIDALRTLIAKVQGTKDGIILVGNIGITSHLGDLLRRAKIPSTVEPSRH